MASQQPVAVVRPSPLLNTPVNSEEESDVPSDFDGMPPLEPFSPDSSDGAELLPDPLPLLQGFGTVAQMNHRPLVEVLEISSTSQRREVKLVLSVPKLRTPRPGEVMPTWDLNSVLTTEHKEALENAGLVLPRYSKLFSYSQDKLFFRDIMKSHLLPLYEAALATRSNLIAWASIDFSILMTEARNGVNYDTAFLPRCSYESGIRRTPLRVYISKEEMPEQNIFLLPSFASGSLPRRLKFALTVPFQSRRLLTGLSGSERQWWHNHGLAVTTLKHQGQDVDCLVVQWNLLETFHRNIKNLIGDPWPSDSGYYTNTVNRLTEALIDPYLQQPSPDEVEDAEGINML